MAEILTVIRDFNVYGETDNMPYGINLPKISAQFVGVSPAIAFDTSNQPKLARDKERKLRKIVTKLTAQFKDDIDNLGSADLAANLQIIQQLITTFKEQIEQEILVPHQLDLESLTIDGEWLTYWQEDAPMVKAKEQQQQNLPQDF